MRNRYAAGFLGVVVEIALCVHVGIVTDDLDRLLVCTNGSVGTEAPEFAADGSVLYGVDMLGDFQRSIGQIVNNTYSEAGFRIVGFQVFKYRVQMRGSCLSNRGRNVRLR